jgi:NADH-quinone oxidoreductase subunit N
MVPSSLRPEWWPSWLTLTVDQDFFAIYPELALTALAFAVLLLAAVFPRREARLLSALAAVGLAFTLVPIVEIYLRLPNHPDGVIVGWGGLYILDPFALFFKALFVISGFLAMLLSVRYLEIEKAQAGEYYALIMFAVVGMMFMASGRDLLMIFVGLETMSISTYVLAGFLKRDRRSNESALKYFLLGSFSTGLLLYGISLLYAVTGTTDLARIAASLPLVSQQPLLVLGMILVVAALGFKIAAVPFHMWVPDTYEGAPTAVAAFFSTGVKAAAFSIVVRILVGGFLEAGTQWAVLLAILSAASMTLGNLGALLQDNVKRMLAYSSVAHAGYVLLGVLAAQRMGETGAFGVAAVAVYLMTYTFTNMGAFGLVTALRREGFTGDQVDDFTGLAKRAPFAAFCMLVFMLSLAGIPATAGFIGKWWLFGSAIKAGYAWLAILAVLNSAVSLYFYLRVVVRMYMGEGGEAHAPFASRPLTLALSISLAFTLWIGLYPQPFLRLAQLAILR